MKKVISFCLICTLLVIMSGCSGKSNRMDRQAEKLLNKYHYHIAKFVGESKMKLTNNPEDFSSSLVLTESKKIGLDLSKEVNKEVTMRTYDLHEKSQEGTGRIAAGIIFNDKRRVAGGMLFFTDYTGGFGPLSERRYILPNNKEITPDIFIAKNIIKIKLLGDFDIDKAEWKKQRTLTEGQIEPFLKLLNESKKQDGPYKDITIPKDKEFMIALTFRDGAEVIGRMVDSGPACRLYFYNVDKWHYIPSEKLMEYMDSM